MGRNADKRARVTQKAQLQKSAALRKEWFDSGAYKAVLVDARMRGFPQKHIDEFMKLTARERFGRRNLFEHWVTRFEAKLPHARPGVTVPQLPMNWLKWASRGDDVWMNYIAPETVLMTQAHPGPTFGRPVARW